jgi:hypothetical protein
MQARAHALAGEQEDAEEHRLGEEREHALHGERRADHAAGVVRERGPVRPELELQGNPRDDAEREVDGEDLRPEARHPLIALALGVGLAIERQTAVRPAEVGDGLHMRDEERQPHREDGEEVVERDRQRELEPVDQDVVVHRRAQ